MSIPHKILHRLVDLIYFLSSQSTINRRDRDQVGIKHQYISGFYSVHHSQLINGGGGGESTIYLSNAMIDLRGVNFVGGLL